MVLTVSFVLSPVIGLVCHRHQRTCIRRLGASVGASGPHDFAVRKSAPSSLAPPASTASRPASVTIASRPSGGRDGEGYRFDLGKARSGIFLQEGLDRKSVICPSGGSAEGLLTATQRSQAVINPLKRYSLGDTGAIRYRIDRPPQRATAGSIDQMTRVAFSFAISSGP